MSVNLHVLSIGWVVERLRHDYGEDLFARRFENGNPTNQDFFIQLKGTNDIDQYRLRRGKWLSYPVELSNLTQWYSYTLPVIFVVWDITRQVGYWAHMQSLIRSALDADSAWLENTRGIKEPTRKVRIPTEQTISKRNLDSLKRVIDAEWRNIQQGKRHFEILYQANGDLIDTTLDAGLPPAIKQQVRITELQAMVAIKPHEAKNWLDLASANYQIHNMTQAMKAINKA